jgi:hypothetical protein
MQVLLAIAVAALTSLVAALAVGVGARLRFSGAEDAFRCKARAIGRRWPRRSARARWVHDVLLIQQGWLRPRVVALPVRFPDDVMWNVSPREIRSLGPAPLLLRLRCDDDTLIDVAARASDRHLLAGPFVAVAFPGVPSFS